MSWIDAVRSADQLQLRGFLLRRLKNPYEEGPVLDERNGEAPEDVFVELAKDRLFRGRLDEVVANYFQSDDSDPAREELLWALRSVLSLVGTLSLSRSGDQIRKWLLIHDDVLRTDPRAILGRATLNALATALCMGPEDGSQFWLGYWHDGPLAWRWRAFVGLRLHDPAAAAAELPALLSRLREQRASPQAMLLGMWHQRAGRAAMLAWASQGAHPQAVREIRLALRDCVPAEELAELRVYF